MADSPTTRTMGELRKLGCICAKVEHFNPYGGARINGKPVGIRQDLFGIVDILVLDPERGFLGIQACSQSSASHLRKMREDRTQECIDWLQTPGGVLEVWCWRKVKLKRGGKAERWQPKVTELTLNEFEVER